MKTFSISFILAVLLLCTAAMTFGQIADDLGANVGSTQAVGVLSAPLAGYNCTHYALQVGTTVTAQILNATDVTPDAQGHVPVIIKSSQFGNTTVQGTMDGTTITFTWTAPANGCQTTIVAYGRNGHNADNTLIAALGNGNCNTGSTAGFAMVDANGNVVQTCGSTEPVCPTVSATGASSNCSLIANGVSLSATLSSPNALTTYSWTGPDPNITNATSATAIVHVFGTYTVTASTPGCADVTATATASDDATTFCYNISVSVDDQTVCEGTKVTMCPTISTTGGTAKAPISYNWQNGFGATISTSECLVIESASLADAGQITLFVTDANGVGGNNSAQPANLNVNPKAKFVFFPSDTTVECGSSTDPNALGVATGDLETGSIVGTPSDAVTPGACTGRYTITRTWSVENGCGIITRTQIITVEDTTRPVLTGVPSDTSLSVQCYSAVPEAPAVVIGTDACQGSVEVLFSQTESNQGSSCNNDVTRTWTATDNCGNKAVFTQVIHVNDTTAPEITEAGPNATIQCPEVASFTAPTATDNCDSHPEVFVVSDNSTPTCGSSYSRTIVWQAKDACGNLSAQKSQTITVEDKTAPVLSGTPLAEVSVSCYGAVEAAATVTANDACQGATEVIYHQSESNPGSSCHNDITRTWSATDACGNNASFTQTIHVNDTEKPVITAISNMTVSGDSGRCTAKVTFGTTAMDNCDAAPSVTYSPASGSDFNPGTTTVTITATDACGNQSTSTFTVTVTSSISGRKFYDTNKNGVQDNGEVAIAGFKIVLSGAASATAYTDQNGNYTFPGLLAGAYTVTEVMPPATASFAYSATTPAAKSITLACPAVVNFSNVCVGTPGGYTKGYWHNQGCKLITASDIAALKGFCLKNVNGSDYDPSQNSGCNKQFSDYLTNTTNASNMAAQLSSQMVATYLNAMHYSNTNVLIDGSRNVMAEITYANGLLCQTGGNYTVTASALRNEQNRVMTIFDKLNNGGSFAQGTPCPVNYAGGAGAVQARRDADNEEVNATVAAPTKFALLGNYPNPFNPSTKISYDIAEQVQVSLTVFDVLGREVASLVNQEQGAGHYEVSFDGTNLSNGIYFYKLQAGSFSAVQKLMLMK